MKKIYMGPNGSGKTARLRKEFKKTLGTYIQSNVSNASSTIFRDFTFNSMVIELHNHNKIFKLIKYFKIENLLPLEYKTLSGGELKLVNIVFQLSMGDEYLYLDEPERDLSEVNKKLLIKYLNKLDSNITLITHDEWVFRYFKQDEIYQFEDYVKTKTKETKWGALWE